MRSGPADLLKCLRSRSHFLRRLRRPRRKRELACELEESRSTIDRALRELESVGFVERADSGYRTTLAGELALAEYDRHTDRLEGLAEFDDALGSLPTDAPLDAALFEDADVSLPSEYAPTRPVEALDETLADADHVRAFGGVVRPAYVELYHERIVEDGMTSEVLVSPNVLEWLLTKCEAETMEIAETDGVTFAETDESFAFNLFVIECDAASAGDVGRERGDRSVGVLLHDEGSLVAFVHNDTREAVAWGEALFDRLAADAVRLGASLETGPS